MVVEKLADGQRYYAFEPPCPPRDIGHRDVAAKHILSILNNKMYRAILDENDLELGKTIERLIKQLGESPSDLTPEFLNELKTARRGFETELSAEPSKPLDLALSDWSQMIELESAKSPLRHAIDELHDKTPDYLFFDDEDRDLASTYDITALRSEIPGALENLLDVAEVETEEIFAAIDAADGAAITTLEHRSNTKLKEKFAVSWQQSGVRVAIRITPALLEVQVVNEASEFSALAERSDGLRQFVALHAFALCNRSTAPVLLIDEAEHRLHYNAQADLVQMLAKQEIASKVIYSTHSAGCLPEDLGNGVRLIRPTKNDETASEIVNKFWADGDDGLMPLLMGLGASTLAFFPTRRAVLVEGPVDMLLYPTMFREFLNLVSLSFQFVHGLSGTGQALAPLVPGKDNRIAYLTDGDAGGLAIVRELERGGVSKDRIVILRNSDATAVEIEDFIDPSLLLLAANNLIERFHPGAGRIAIADLTVVRRMSSLEAAYMARTGVNLPKVELAYGLLDLIDEKPGLVLLDSRRRASFGKVVQRILDLFET